MKPVYKTKGELRSKLLIRLGYGGLGAAAGNYVSMADDLLENAQEEIFEILPNRYRVRDFDKTLGIGQQWLSIPDGCEADEIHEIRVYYAGYWHPLVEGINYAHDSVADTTSYPQRYEISYNPTTEKAQIEFWPDTDAEYQIRINAEMALTAFEADADLCCVDYRLLLLHAIAYGKSHLNKPDKDDAMRAWMTRRKKLVGNQHKGKRYIRGQIKNREVLAKPVVI